MAPFPFAKNNFSVTRVEASDSKLLNEIHERAFSHVWDTATFSSFLSDPQVFGFMVRLIGQPKRILGFVLCRLVLDEAEIITIAVHPNFRNRGIGHILMDATFRHLHHERTKELFLEVDEKNEAALTLYRQFDFKEVGRRPAYYQSDTGRSDALIMQRLFKVKSTNIDNTDG